MSHPRHPMPCMTPHPIPAATSHPCHDVPSLPPHPIGDTTSHPCHHLPSLDQMSPATTSIPAPCPTPGGCPSLPRSPGEECSESWKSMAGVGLRRRIWGTAGCHRPAGDTRGPLSPALRPRTETPCTCLHTCERACVCVSAGAGPCTHPARGGGHPARGCQRGAGDGGTRLRPGQGSLLSQPH